MKAAFADRDAIILPDNDDAGRAHLLDVAANIFEIAKSVRIVELPGLPEKGDVSDWLSAGGTKDRLPELVAATEPLTAAPEIPKRPKHPRTKQAEEPRPPLSPEEARREILNAVSALLAAKAHADEEALKEARNELRRLLDQPVTHRAALGILDEAERPGPVTTTLAREALEHDGFGRLLADVVALPGHFAVDAGRLLHVYCGGAYRPDGELHVRRRAQGLLERLGLSSEWGSRRVLEAVEYLAVRSPRLWDRPPRDTVNLLNGLLDVYGRELPPHTRGRGAPRCAGAEGPLRPPPLRGQ
ncbi:MAG: hypothetical protein HY721_08315 [Planctomycetes bacterium]|nr:hypothetical protein [Planctomycetota bacterium]